MMVHKLIQISETWHDSLLTRVFEANVIKIWIPTHCLENTMLEWLASVLLVQMN
jgi:hypothetical protein